MSRGRRRPLVVLVPDVMAWVLGDWSLEIARHNAQDFDFAIFPLREIRERPEGFAAVLREAEIVHCLSQSGFAEVRERTQALGGERAALVSAVHHLVEPDDARACLAADRVAVMCEATREALLRQGLAPERIFLLRKGVDLARLRRRDRAAARKRLGIPDDAFAVGFSAKASSDDRGRKGVDVLFEALARVPRCAGRPLHLVVTGPGWREQLARHAPAGVETHGFSFLAADAMPDYYSALDVYLCTSRVEGGPMPPFEAMSCETPIVSTPVGCVRDLVSDGAEGLLVPIGDAQATARALLRLRDDPDVAQGLGVAGRRRVEQCLAPERVARAAGALYRALDTEPRPRTLGAETLAQGNGARIERDLERWRRGLGDSPGGGLCGRLARRAQRRPARPGRAAGAPRDEVAHVDLAWLEVGPGSRLLDLGCGAGQLSLPLLERGVVALSADLSAPRLRLLRGAAEEGSLQARPLRCDGAQLPVASAALDAVVCREMLEHVAAPGRVLDEIRRVLRPAGRLCVTVPSAHTERWFQWVDARWFDMAGHVHVFRRRDMRRLLERHGFELVEVRGRNCFYSFFWFVHTLAGTTHDGTGRIRDHHGLARRVFRLWRCLGRGRLLRLVTRVGDALVPKSYVYYAVVRD